jgi:hypothetical protein
VPGKDTQLLFVVQKDFSLFTTVEVDGVQLTADQFHAVSGSTRVTLLPSLLDKLAGGQHTVRINFSDGVGVEQAFTVNAPADAPAKEGLPAEVPADDVAQQEGSEVDGSQVPSEASGSEASGSQDSGSQAVPADASDAEQAATGRVSTGGTPRTSGGNVMPVTGTADSGHGLALDLVLLFSIGALCLAGFVIAVTPKPRRRPTT